MRVPTGVSYVFLWKTVNYFELYGEMTSPLQSQITPDFYLEQWRYRKEILCRCYGQVHHVDEGFVKLFAIVLKTTSPKKSFPYTLRKLTGKSWV